MAMYFTRNTENAIVAFNNTTCSMDRNYIYEAEIHTPMHKLVENIIHTFKFYSYDTTYEDLKHDTVSFLFDKLGNYNQDDSKAYSYFTIVARNYLIGRSRTISGATQYKPLEEVDSTRSVVNEAGVHSFRDTISSFTLEWSAWGLTHCDQLFHRKRDRVVAEAVFVLFRDSHHIENYNKKSLYILIREYSGNITTQYITRVVNRLRVMYADMYSDYNKNVVIDWNGYRVKYIQIDREEL